MESYVYMFLEASKDTVVQVPIFVPRKCTKMGRKHIW